MSRCRRSSTRISGSALAVVTVSADQPHADRELAAAADEIERVEPGLVTRTEVEFLG